MSGDSRLRSVQDLHDVPNTKFPALQDVENPQPRPVGKRAEHQVDAARYFGLCSIGHFRSREVVFA